MRRLPSYVAISLAMLLSLNSHSAYADWQYTRWGMTEAEVLNASAGRAGPIASQDVQGGSIGTVNRLSAPYAAGRYQFRAIFGFDSSGRLAGVLLKVLNKDDGPAIRNDLLGKYGQPLQIARGTQSTWRWHADNDEIMFMDTLGQHFSILYRPRTSAGASGL